MVVNEKGVVTSVSDVDATATVTATSNYDPTKSASCEVTVFILHQDLNGIVWDENGEVWFSEFDVGTLPAYEKLNASNMKLDLTGAAYDEEGTLYAVTFDSDNWTSDLYVIDETDYSAELVGSSSIGYMDICAAPSLGGDYLLAVYGYYVVVVDKTTGEYIGVFNYSEETDGNYFVGIAYEELYDIGYGDTDWVFLLDEAGNLYSGGFLLYNGSIADFGVEALGTIGDEVDIPFWQSLYYDGTNLFWSRFNYDDNKVDLVMVNDIYEDGTSYNLGSFADSVWPVGGLYEAGINPANGFAANDAADHSDAVIDTETVFSTEVEKISFSTKTASKGGLNAVRMVSGVNATSSGAPQLTEDSSDTVLYYSTDVDSTNGKITVEYPEEVTVKSVKAENFHQRCGRRKDRIRLCVRTGCFCWYRCPDRHL